MSFLFTLELVQAPQQFTKMTLRGVLSAVAPVDPPPGEQILAVTLCLTSPQIWGVGLPYGPFSDGCKEHSMVGWPGLFSRGRDRRLPCAGRVRVETSDSRPRSFIPTRALPSRSRFFTSGPSKALAVVADGS